MTWKGKQRRSQGYTSGARDGGTGGTAGTGVADDDAVACGGGVMSREGRALGTVPK